MTKRSLGPLLLGAAVIGIGFLIATTIAQSTCPGGRYNFIRIVADLFGQGPRVRDLLMQNPWGMAQGLGNSSYPYPGQDNIWVVSQVLSVATVYDGDGNIINDENGQQVTVTFTPGSGTGLDAYRASYPGEALPVSIVFNPSNEFNLTLWNNATAPSKFIVGSLDAALHAWHPNLTQFGPARTAVNVLNVTLAAYTGLAIGKIPAPNTTNINSTTTNTTVPLIPVNPTPLESQWRLYAADLKGAQVHVFDGLWRRVDANGTQFQDNTLPVNYAPYNIWVFEDSVYVSYAERDPFSGDRSRIPGAGAINQFDTNGKLIRRLMTGGVLASPFGMALAPPSWGPLGGKFIVGNAGDGLVWAFDWPNPDATNGDVLNINTGSVLGGNVNLNIKSLQFGNGAPTQPLDVLFWVRGVGDRETHGTLARVEAVNC